MAILLKDARDAASPEDGVRVLVDRQRPQGLEQEDLAFQIWLPELAPSAELRRWFHDKPAQWPLFRRRYLAELCDESAVEALNQLETISADAKQTTLLTSAEDAERSHAAILRDLLEGVKKPPATSGPSRAAASGRIRARRPH
jgi:uncharacterized protein YeaO (DUF488 family)